jgi:hypothetical protein
MDVQAKFSKCCSHGRYTLAASFQAVQVSIALSQKQCLNRTA